MIFSAALRAARASLTQLAVATLHAFLLALVLTLPLQALAQTTFTNSNVNIRAGPDRAFPLVGWIPARSAVRVHGCTSGWRWCDVAAGRNRGWVHSRYLSTISRSRTPVVTFSVGSYWDQHYRGRPWYSSRNDWMGWGQPSFRPSPRRRW